MSIEATVKRILVDDLFVSVPQAEIGLDDGLRDVLGLDSLGFTELRAQCEYAFDITIPDEDFVPENFSTVRDLTLLVKRLGAPVPDGAGSR
ncbi:acyl carrier protein [Streptomyces sp. NBC_01314]|uniref:acyl carrier protein n=1 Tax=Streptomyces sp. NBC_01314 TaxID=2903821 RepID=UPI00308E17D9|nr:phosphopantetheine-binding protein [Streptomyces sp. NBC_01314]